MDFNKKNNELTQKDILGDNKWGNDFFCIKARKAHQVLIIC